MRLKKLVRYKMLLDDFYTVIEKIETEESNVIMDVMVRKFIFTIKLNPEHSVYRGHFPGNPIVPGVCQVQIIKELVSSVLKTDLVFRKSDNIKFLSMIVPTIFPQVNVSIDIREKEPGSWHVTSIISNEDQVFLKFKGVMQTV